MKLKSIRDGICFVEVGRCLQEIEQVLRDIRATAVVTDDDASRELDRAKRAARKLVRALERISLED